MAWNSNRCPRCGRNRNRGAAGRTDGAATVLSGSRSGCTAPETVAEELYAGTTPDIVMATCCDRWGCRECDTRCRDPYWPRFCHPRWLSCRALYSRRVR